MLIFLLFLYSNFFSFLDFSSTYPVHYSEYESFKGGRIIASSEGDGLFYIKPNIGSEDEMIYSWGKIENKSTKGIAISDSYIIDALAFEDKLFLLVHSRLDIQCILLDKNLKRQANISLPINIDDITNLNGRIIGKISKDIIAVHVDCYLIYINDLTGYMDFILIDDDVDYAAVIDVNESTKQVLAIKKDKQYGSISQYDEVGHFVRNSRVQLSKKYRIISSKDYYTVVTNSGNSRHSFLQLIEKSSGNLFLTKWLDVNLNNIELTKDNNLVFIKKDGENVSLSINSFSPAGLKNISENIVPNFLLTPNALKINDDEIIGIFKQGTAVFDLKGGIIGSVGFATEPKFTDEIEVFNFDNFMIISSDYHSDILSKNENEFWLVNRVLYEIWIYIIPLILLLILLYVFRRKKASDRLLRRVLNLQSSGIIYFLDAKGMMKSANDEGKKLIGVTSFTLRRKHHSVYLKKDLTMPIYRLLVRAIESGSTIREKITLKFPEGEQEWIASAVVLRNVTGAFRGVVFSGVDITEQLEKKRLTNWAQLAHDMQTNLSTIRLNCENIEVGTEEVMTSKKAILHQTNLLIRRVRDIVTVGRQEEIVLEKQNSDEICFEARSEFDEAMFPGVKFELKIESFQVYCDRARMVRAIRNAVENGIKAMPDRKGKITISAKRAGGNAQFSIRDTGKGMDAETKKKMLQPYFTTAKNKGGHGIGTMIIQKVVEMHGGEMLVNSEVGVGTEIIIVIPNYKRKISND